MKHELTEEVFKNWLEHPVTKELRRILHAKREAMRQEWEGGSYTDYSRESTALINVANIGTCRGYAYVSDLDWSIFSEDMDDGE